MIGLFFVTCLSTAPDICQQRSLLFDDRIGLAHCQRDAQTELARWVESHPRDRVQRWSCRAMVRGQAEI
ncbi:hypothetical protein [Paracoccus seriniphilus]|uniref:hypothetical protein n=1 Tax=Paracoccus seriniphilus TaxID=184748 RepID=UPI0035689D34